MPVTEEEDSAQPAPAGVSHALHVTWTFVLNGTEVGWLWQRNGRPPLDELQPLRIPTASALNRHVAVTAYSMTNNAALQLESGLEHDLLRRVDRDPRILHIVAQPLRLSWKGGPPNRHVPDLLTVSADGSVVVWDVRSSDQQDDDFNVKSSIALAACAAVGWQYQVFGGLEPVERINLLWLHGFRRQPTWTVHHRQRIMKIAKTSGATLGKVLNADDGTGELKSAVWHLIWCSALDIDIRARWTEDTAICVPGMGNSE